MSFLAFRKDLPIMVDQKCANDNVKRDGSCVREDRSKGTMCSPHSTRHLLPATQNYHRERSTDNKCKAQCSRLRCAGIDIYAQAREPRRERINIGSPPWIMYARLRGGSGHAFQYYSGPPLQLHYNSRPKNPCEKNSLKIVSRPSRRHALELCPFQRQCAVSATPDLRGALVSPPLDGGARLPYATTRRWMISGRPARVPPTLPR